MPSIIPENYKVVWNNSEVVLNTNDIVGRGGEAILFRVAPDKILKIYLPDRINPVRIQKNRDLVSRSMNLPRDCINPLSIVTDAKTKKDVGIEIMNVDTNRYSLLTHWLIDGIFRQQNNVSPDDIYFIFSHIREIVASLHQAGFVIGDFNPSGIFVLDKLEWANPNASIIKMIDVDSLAFDNYPCFVCSLYWCDFTLRHEIFNDLGKRRIFKPEHDWFAFDALLFNALTGIHPYSGYHPIFDVSKFKFEQGMTVLHPDVEYPIDVMQLADMPAALVQRFDQTFNTRVREEFPAILMNSLVGGQPLPTIKQPQAPIMEHKSSPIHVGSKDVYVNVLMDYDGIIMDLVVDNNNVSVCYQHGNKTFFRQYRNKTKSASLLLTNNSRGVAKFVNPTTIAYNEKMSPDNLVTFSDSGGSVQRMGDLGFGDKPILGFANEGHVFSEMGTLNLITKNIVGVDKRTPIIKTNSLAGFAPVKVTNQIAGVHWYAVMNTYILSVVHNNRIDRIDIAPLEPNEFVVGNIVAHLSRDQRYMLIVRTSELNGVRRHLFVEVNLSHSSGAVITNQLLIEKLSQLDMRRIAYDSHTVVYALQNRIFALSLTDDRIHEFATTKGIVAKDSWVRSYENGILVVGGNQVKYMRM